MTMELCRDEGNHVRGPVVSLGQCGLEEGDYMKAHRYTAI